MDAFRTQQVPADSTPLSLDPVAPAPRGSRGVDVNEGLLCEDDASRRGGGGGRQRDEGEEKGVADAVNLCAARRRCLSFTMGAGPAAGFGCSSVTLEVYGEVADEQRRQQVMVRSRRPAREGRSAPGQAGKAPPWPPQVRRVRGPSRATDGAMASASELLLFLNASCAPCADLGPPPDAILHI
ncbi:Protein of unknown function, partial [Gryllus bimaculatus]